MDKDTPRKHRLIRDTLNAVAHDRAGLEDALWRECLYTTPLTGLSLRNIGAAFRSAVNLIDRQAYNENFRPDEIAAHPAFAELCKTMNDNGMFIPQLNGRYPLFVFNKSHTRGKATSILRFPVFPLDYAGNPSPR